MSAAEPEMLGQRCGRPTIAWLQAYAPASLPAAAHERTDALDQRLVAGLAQRAVECLADQPLGGLRLRRHRPEEAQRLRRRR